MKLASAVKALGSLCLLLTDGFLVSEASFPWIIGPDKVYKKAHLGEPLILHCDAFTSGEDDMTLIYWLINSAFPDEISSSDRIIESEESTLEGGVLQKSLLLKNVTSEDLKSTFTCVVTSAAGMAQKQILLTTTRSDCKLRKRSHRM